MIQPRPKFAENNLLKCTKHSKDVDSFSQSKDLFGFTQTRLLCSQCQVDTLDEKPTKAFFKAYSNLETFTMSIPNLPKPSSDDPFSLNPPLDFFNHQLEQVIIDYKSKGYGSRNLVYIPDKQLLAACSTSGRVLIWSMGDNITFREEFDIRKTIKNAKYIAFAENKRYLVIAAGLDLHIYEVKDEKTELVKVLGCEWEVSDFDYNPQAAKLIAVGASKSLKAWKVQQNFFPEEEESLKELDVDAPIITAIYLQEKNQLALEHKKGLSLFNLDSQGFVKKEGLKHLKGENKGCSGMEYLAKSNTLILAKTDGVELIDVNTLTKKFKYIPMTLQPQPHPVRFLANQDESQVIANTNKNFFYLFASQKCHYQSAGNQLSAISSIEVLPDQCRMVLANAASGTLFIFRTNLKADKSVPNLKTATPTSDEMKQEQDLISFEGQSPLIPGEKSDEIGINKSLAGEFNMIEEKDERKNQKDSDEELPLFDMQDYAMVHMEEEGETPVAFIDQKRKWMKDPYLHDEKEENNLLGLVTFTKQQERDPERIIEVTRERKSANTEEDNKAWVVLWEDENDHKRRGKVIDWKSETRGLRKGKRSSEDSRSRSRSSSKESERKRPEENKPPRMKSIMETIKGAKAIMKIINLKCKERREDD